MDKRTPVSRGGKTERGRRTVKKTGSKSPIPWEGSMRRKRKVLSRRGEKGYAIRGGFPPRLNNTPEKEEKMLQGGKKGRHRREGHPNVLKEKKTGSTFEKGGRRIPREGIRGSQAGGRSSEAGRERDRIRGGGGGGSEPVRGGRGGKLQTVKMMKSRSPSLTPNC